MVKKPFTMRCEEDVLDMAKEISAIEEERTGYNISITNVFEKAVRELYKKITGDK